MRLTLLTFILITAILSTSASAIWYLDSQSITADVSVTSGLNVDYGSGAAIDYVTANVSFVPKQSLGQEVIRVSAKPQYDHTGDELVFRWDNPSSSALTYTVDMRVRTQNTFLKVGKSAFPYDGFPDSVARYAVPTQTVDADDPAVISKASELAAGESDYYYVVFKMAEWTRNNIEYDLSTLNIKASNKASEVIRSRNGVCDEMTTLFMALLRAVGIPAKFVTGVAYTESPAFPQKWGAHGWAEVYFPGTGWVPFDVTYGQFGFVDPTHIKMKESDDAADPDTSYEWLGRDVDIFAKPIVVSADIVKREGRVPDRIGMSVRMVEESVGIGSYDLVEATVTNKEDSYVSALVFLANVHELDIIGNKEQAVMLEPRGTKTVYWLVKVDDNLPVGYTYTFPVTAATLHNTTVDTSFFVVPGNTVFTRDQMRAVIDAAEKEEVNVYSKRINITCAQELPGYYIYDKPVVECDVKNTGNFNFKGLKFCFEDTQCQTADLAISQEKAFSTTITEPGDGINRVKFSVEGKDVSKTFFYDLEILDEPEISIDDIEYPSQLEFKNPYTVRFTLKKESRSDPQDVVLTFDAAGLEKTIEMSEMPGDKKMVFNLDSGDLSVKPNDFIIAVVYEDANGKTYTAKEAFEISLINVTFGQRVIIWLQDLDTAVRGWFK